MGWLIVKVDPGGGYEPVDNVVNTDNIVRFGSRGTGSYMKFVDGTSVDLLDAYTELIAEIQKLKE
jgi:hypothetical protein